MSIKIGGKTINDYSAMQAMCSSGYHVPSKDEWVGLFDLGRAMGAWGYSDGNGVMNYLKFPLAGYRGYNDSSVYAQGSFGFYWASTSQNNDNYSYAFRFSATYVGAQDGDGRASGFSVRAFKDNFVAPTSSWTTLYAGTGSAGIFYNSADGIISITSDGSTGYTIADKNEGATTVYNNGDTLSESNCGKYYQRGNNYGFAWTGGVSYTTSQVDASTYGPGNYYSSSTFIKRTTTPYRWDTTNNKDLRGGDTGVQTEEVEPKNIYVRINVPDYTVQRKNRDSTVLETDLNVMEGTTPTYDGATPTRSGYDFTGWNPTPAPIYSDTDYTAQFEVADVPNRGPCPSGYHIPTKDERQNVYDIGVTIGAWTSSGGDYLKLYLKLPYAGYRSLSNSDVTGQGNRGRYQSSTYYNSGLSYYMSFTNGSIGPASAAGNAGGYSIRAFKNTPVIPDSSWTVLYSGSGGNGIYWNSTLGLITVVYSSFRYTLADKNLGATNVYNNGDTLSEANCGKYYQWGNNYGFPWTGSVTTSTTKIDASAYGPGNYYSSSTYIAPTSTPYCWDYSYNGNLRGGEDA